MKLFLEVIAAACAIGLVVAIARTLRTHFRISRSVRRGPRNPEGK